MPQSHLLVWAGTGPGGLDARRGHQRTLGGWGGGEKQLSQKGRSIIKARKRRVVVCLKNMELFIEESLTVQFLFPKMGEKIIINYSEKDSCSKSSSETHMATREGPSQAPQASFPEAPQPAAPPVLFHAFSDYRPGWGLRLLAAPSLVSPCSRELALCLPHSEHTLSAL